MQAHQPVIVDAGRDAVGGSLRAETRTRSGA